MKIAIGAAFLFMIFLLWSFHGKTGTIPPWTELVSLTLSLYISTISVFLMVDVFFKDLSEVEQIVPYKPNILIAAFSTTAFTMTNMVKTLPTYL